MTNIRTLAKYSLEEAGGDFDKARELLAGRITQDQMPSILKIAITSLMREAASEQRREIFDRGMHGVARRETKTYQIPSGPSDRMTSIIRQRGFYDFLLPGGGKLGDASFDDIRSAIALYDSQRTGLSRRINFLIGILEREKKGKRVRDVWGEAEIAMIAQQQGEELTDAAA